jgi:hypothetical protein
MLREIMGGWWKPETHDSVMVKASSCAGMMTKGIVALSPSVGG